MEEILQRVKVHSQATKHEQSFGKCHIIWHRHSELAHFFLKVLLPSLSPYHQPTSISTVFRAVIHKKRPSEGRLIKYVSIVFLMCSSNMLSYSFLLWCALGPQQHYKSHLWDSFLYGAADANFAGPAVTLRCLAIQ